MARRGHIPQLCKSVWFMKDEEKKHGDTAAAVAVQLIVLCIAGRVTCNSVFVSGLVSWHVNVVLCPVECYLFPHCLCHIWTDKFRICEICICEISDSNNFVCWTHIFERRCLLPDDKHIQNVHTICSAKRTTGHQWAKPLPVFHCLTEYLTSQK